MYFSMSERRLLSLLLSFTWFLPLQGGINGKEFLDSLNMANKS